MYEEHSLHIARGLPLATAALAASIFIVDTIATVDLAFGTFYAGVVLLAARFCTHSRLVLVAVGCVGLTVLSFAISHYGEPDLEGAVNTVIGVGVIGLTTWLVLNIHNDAKQRIRAAEALREMESQLAHANRVAIMGQLTASIAHEVAQPITATIGNAEATLRWLANRPPDLEEARKLLARIVKDGHRASNVLGRIRDLIKKAPPRIERMEINGAIREVIELTRGEAMKNCVSVQTRLAQGLPLVEADRTQLQQVILNLIINAVQAVSQGGQESRELLVSTSMNGSNGVLISVRDSGPGVSPESLGRLFDPFYTTKPDGMGMGLSICRSIIEAHGGRLWATANEPPGAVFQFSLPAASPNVSPNRHSDVATPNPQ